MASDEKGKVYNHDVASLSQMLFRIGTEVYKSVSSNASFVSEHDFKRIISYLDWLTGKLNWIAARPLMDLPESAPEPFAVDVPKQYAQVENESCNDILRLVYIFLIELQNSQSARIASGLISHDEGRVRVILQKLYDFMNQFVQSTHPIDLPESSPMSETSGKGRLGV